MKYISEKIKSGQIVKSSRIHYLVFILFQVYSSFVYAQSVADVRVTQTEDDRIVIKYDLLGESHRSFEVSLLLSRDGGQNFTISPRTVSGDVGENIKSGRGNEIVWDALMDVPRLQGDNFIFRVTAVLRGRFSLKGTWRGIVNQAGYGSYSVVMTIKELIRGRKCGTIRYPTLSCGGSLILTEIKDEEYLFREKIEYGGGCVNDGIVRVAKRSEVKIAWDWFYPNGSKGASAILDLDMKLR